MKSYYRIVWKTTSHYIHITRTETRIIQEVVLYLRSHYIVSATSILIFEIYRIFFYVYLEYFPWVFPCLCSKSWRRYLNRHYINLSRYTNVVNARAREIRGQNISHYIRGRTILKVTLYENSGAIFSHYIRGRVVI